MGVVLPEPGFLEGLRKACDQYGALLIFDEVISGFRMGLGGAQEYFGVMPDLTCLGKIIGGGLPVGAYGGKKEILLQMAPEGLIYQAGTLSGNPLAVAAGLATLQVLKEEDPYPALAQKMGGLMEGILAEGRKLGLPLTVNRIGSLATVFFTPGPVRNYEEAKTARTDLFAGFYGHLLEAGIYLPPSQFEAWFLSTAHTDRDLEITLTAAGKAFQALAR
jgi:glutamate-1-semialdehyde 2,1-aminomutase